MAEDPTKLDDDVVVRLEKALKEALQRSEAAEAVIQDQRQRLKALGVGREETMRALTEVREELRRVGIERDELRKQLARLDGVQTATIAIPDDDPGPHALPFDVPSLEDLMAALGVKDGSREAPVAGHLHQRVQNPHASEDSEEMISPALVFPEKFAASANVDKDAAFSRVLVLLDAEHPIKFPLAKEVMTIGRADIADIHIDNGFLSRLHARVISTARGVAIEDIESKNGIRVNAKLVTRQDLRHGDVVDLGRLRFRYIDTESEDAD